MASLCDKGHGVRFANKRTISSLNSNPLCATTYIIVIPVSIIVIPVSAYVRMCTPLRLVQKFFASFDSKREDSSNIVKKILIPLYE
jgi:hypothetical protein